MKNKEISSCKCTEKNKHDENHITIITRTTRITTAMKNPLPNSSTRPLVRAPARTRNRT
jgi:hypothetical protein